MNRLRAGAKRIPLLRGTYRVFRRVYLRCRSELGSVYWAVRKQYVEFRLKSKSAEDAFTWIYQRNKWGGTDSVSGQGSDAEQTRHVVSGLSGLIREKQIRSVLDIPCGDFHWMKNVELAGADYIGADIVRDIVEQNEKIYAREGLRFEHLDLMNDALPTVDLVFSRDCLVHFSYEDIFKALHNICAGDSKYLLTSTFVERAENTDIVTGQWRPLNLEVPPFSLPAPVALIDEECSQYNGSYRDKALGLWRIEDIRACLPQSGDAPRQSAQWAISTSSMSTGSPRSS